MRMRFRLIWRRDEEEKVRREGFFVSLSLLHEERLIRSGECCCTVGNLCDQRRGDDGLNDVARQMSWRRKKETSFVLFLFPAGGTMVKGRRVQGVTGLDCFVFRRFAKRQ